MGSVDIVLDYVVADGRSAPTPRPAPGRAWRLHALAVERGRHASEGRNFHTDHAEYAPDHEHGLFIHEVAIPSGVVLETVVGTIAGQDLSLFHLLQFSASCPLGGLGPFVLGELVEDAIGKLAFRTIVAPIIQGTDLGAVLVELPPEQVVIGWLPSEAVPVLGKHHRDTACGHQVPYAVHARPLQARTSLARVLNRLEDLVPLACSVLPKGLELLC